MFANASHSSRLSAVAPVPGDATVLARVSELIADLKPDDVDLLKGLHRIQHEFQYIPKEAIRLLAAQLNTTPAIIYGTIDFYSELRQSPPAENVVGWCSGPACLLKNSQGIRRALEAVLGCRMNEASADGKYELQLVQCDGTCELAPLIRYGGEYIGPLTASEAVRFARRLKGEPAMPEGGAEGDVPAAAADLTPQETTEDALESGPLGEPTAGPRPMATPDEDPTREPGE
ncbi:MAG TPA: NAD(P)H-dependent oxidoreductase subunit E [Dehalococcoidia bacterium]|nr:NAD(P)H-dependent oxidoreductase subunit E [Dehalococcoidia bacterium]